MATRPTRYAALEGILDDLVASYAGDSPLNELETCTMPNRRATVRAFWKLQHVLLLGYFGTEPLHRDNLRLRLAEHLLPAYDGLVHQITRAVSWTDRALPDLDRRGLAWAEEAVLGLFRDLPELRRLLDGDVHAAFAGDPAASSIEEVIFSYPGLLAVTAHRVAHRLHRAGVPLIPRILAEHAHSRTGIDIHPAATVGERLFIDHGTGVVIGATSVLGDDVKLYQGVTLGALSIPRGQHDVDGPVVRRHPVLEDRVTVYAGATILGGDTIVGADSVIGGNVWLTRSVPPGSKILRRPTDEAAQTHIHPLAPRRTGSDPA